MALRTTLFIQTIRPIFLVIAPTTVVSRYVNVDAGALSRASIYLFVPALVFHSIASGEMNLSVTVIATCAGYVRRR